MSNYRDDMNDTAVISDRLLMWLTDLGESTALASSALLFSLTVMSTDSAAVSDHVVDGWVTAPIVETAKVSDTLLSMRKLRDDIVELGALSGDVSGERITVVTEESAAVSDDFTAKVGMLVTDSAAASDEVVSSRETRQLVEESLALTDQLIALQRTEVVEVATASDALTQKLVAQNHVEVSATISDELDADLTQTQLIEEAALASDETADQLYAKTRVTETVFIDDAVIQAAGGQAWTAFADGWAMSRYDPFTARSLVAIDGVLYASTPQGVYALDSATEVVKASVQTGRITLGETKCVPRYAHIEYELDGDAEMLVTQSGDGSGAESFSYPLTPRASDADASGRFVFGKGLRDKRFAFRLDVEGTRCEVYGLSLDVVPFERKI